MSEKCGASCESGIGTELVCAKPVGHSWNHEDRWTGRSTSAPYVRTVYRTSFTDEQVEKYPYPEGRR